MRATAKRTRRTTAASAPVAAPAARKESGAASTRTANARAYQQLKQAVLSGRFRPGEVVTLRSVMKLLGAREMAAREAVKRLISEGGFNALPNRSARAPVLGRKEAMQLCELRIMLESEAAAAAAANITLHQIGALRVMHEKMADCVASGDLEQYKCLNMAFHFEIYRIADNPPLASLIESLWLRLAPFISRTINWVVTVPGRFPQIANRRHEEMLSAFQRRDVEAARLAMRADIGEIHETEGYWAALDDWSPAT